MVDKNMTIFKKNIREIPASKFKKARLEVDGETKSVKGAAEKRIVESMAEGGVSKFGLEKKLSQAGMKGDQYYKRKGLMEVVTGSGKKEKAPEKSELEAEARETDEIFQPEIAEEKNAAEDIFDEAA